MNEKRDFSDEIAGLLRKINGGKLRGSQTVLAKKVGVQPGTVSRWVSGKAAMGEDAEIAVAKVLGVSVPELHRAISGPKEKETSGRTPCSNSDLCADIDELKGMIAEQKKQNDELRKMMFAISVAISEQKKTKAARGE